MKALSVYFCSLPKKNVNWIGKWFHYFMCQKGDLADIMNSVQLAKFSTFLCDEVEIKISLRCCLEVC